GGGCRSWLVAERNTVTHEFVSVTAAPGAGAALAARAGE
ncbi:sarcosine oxidase subunit delta, partial [Mesorhizobium sp. M2E.F.Ca.ET.166.01.1.1]